METLGQVSKPCTFKNQLSLETGRLSKTDPHKKSPSPVLGKWLQFNFSQLLLYGTLDPYLAIFHVIQTSGVSCEISPFVRFRELNF